MASELGADIELEKIGTKYPGLAPWEIWLSEAQERMVLAVPEVSVGAFAELCSRFGSEFWDIGSFRGDGRLVIRMRGEVVLDLPMEFVHKGIPQKRLVAEAPVKNRGQTTSLPKGAPQKVKKRGLTPFFKNVSCERIVRRYDYEVQGGTVVKPFAGPEGDAPQDAAVLKPQGTGGAWGIALSNALRPDYAEIDPYRAAWAVVDEAVRNAVAVGSDPERIAILDNFCMGDPNDPAVMWALLESARGLRDAALAFGTPIISGKDSFYNEYLGPDGRRHAVPPSLLVSALGFVPDVSKAVTSFLKSPGDSIWLVGRFEPSFLDKDAAGAEADLGAVPGVDPGAQVVYKALFEAMQAGEVAAAHDLSEGGLTLALAEMCMGGRKGADIVLPPSQEPAGRAMKECAASPLGLHGMVRDLLLFGESAGCLLVEVRAGQDEAFGRHFGEEQAFRIGAVSQMPVMRIHDGDSEILSVSISDMLKAWKDSAGEVLP
jgi:phosphoribosylformylglycinamidine synthase